jgi:gamma-carbonic anhydrase
MNTIEPQFYGLLPTFHLPDARPRRAASAYVAPGAVVIGAVVLGEQSSVWYTAVLRGDINSIHIGDQSNVQDGSVLHVSDDHACIIGQRVTIGHRAVVHACRVHNEVLVGMGAILLDGCEIGAGSIIAAGAVVPKGLKVPAGSLVMGCPGKIVRVLTEAEQEGNRRLAMKYVELSRRFMTLPADCVAPEA